MTRFKITVTNEETGEYLSTWATRSDAGKVEVDKDHEHGFIGDFFDTVEKIQLHEEVLGAVGTPLGPIAHWQI